MNQPGVNILSFCRSIALCLLLFQALQRNLQAQTGVDELKDRPLRIRNKVKPDFPAALRNSHYYQGFAKVVFMVDTSGRSYDFILIEATHPLFGVEAISALQRWQVEPAIIDSRINPSRHTVEVKFRNVGLAIEKRLGGGIPTREKPDSSVGTYYHTFDLNELDRIPKYLAKDSPVLPTGIEPAEMRGLVKIEFFIDEKGKVRAPGVLMSTNDRLDDAAITAVVNWQFEPPLKDGKPVVARAVQSFLFE